MKKHLTGGERMVMFLFARGHSVEDIGKMQGVPESRVLEIKKSFMTKLGAVSCVHALYLAVRQGLIEL